MACFVICWCSNPQMFRIVLEWPGEFYTTKKAIRDPRGWRVGLLAIIRGRDFRPVAEQQNIERFVIDDSWNAQSLTPTLPMNLKLAVGLG